MTEYIVTFLNWAAMDRDSRWNLSGAVPEETFLRTVRQAIVEERFRYRDQKTVTAASLEDVFRMLNTEDHGQCRSLSVGDVIMDTDCREWVVAPFGFKALFPRREG